MSSSSIFQALPPTEQSFDCLSFVATCTWQVCTTLSLSNFIHDKAIAFFNPAISEDKQKISEFRAKLSEDPSCHFVHFLTPEGSRVHGALFSARYESGVKKAIIYAQGSRGTYEKIANPQSGAAQFFKFFREEFGDDTTLLVINYEGIGESEGTPSLENWATDLYSAYEFLKNEGFDDILMYGHSLGGHLTLKACAKIAQRHLYAPPAVIDRSFKNTVDLIFYRTSGGTAGRIVQGITLYSGLHSDIAPLDDQRVLLINAFDDPTIPYPAGMTSQFQKSDVVEVMEISGQSPDLPEFSSHVRPVMLEERAKVAHFIRTALNL